MSSEADPESEESEEEGGEDAAANEDREKKEPKALEAPPKNQRAMSEHDESANYMIGDGKVVDPAVRTKAILAYP